MAKKDEKKALDSIFKKTEKPKREPKENQIKPTTFGLSELEIAELQEIADKNSVARNAVGRYAIQYFLKEYKENRTKLKKQKVTKLQAP